MDVGKYKCSALNTQGIEIGFAVANLVLAGGTSTGKLLLTVSKTYYSNSEKSHACVAFGDLSFLVYYNGVYK